MNIKLSNIGLKKYLAYKNKDIILNEIEYKILNKLYQNVYDEYNSNFKQYLESGLIEYEKDDLETTKQLYKYPFLENVKRIHFEITTNCNFKCTHCRSGEVKIITETHIERLFQIADLFIELGIKRFDFIGGEVSLFGKEWLNLVKYIKQKEENTVITLYSNGWFLEKTNFMIDEKSYLNDIEYFKELKNAGLTHILFSIDGNKKIHDNQRGHKGLFKRILNSIDRVKKVGIYPRLSVVIKKNESQEHLLEFANKIYDKKYKNINDAIFALQCDTYNSFSNFIDINNGANLRKGNILIEESNLLIDHIKCKSFYRPSPTLRIKADGSIGFCPLMNQDEQYGNIDDKGIIEIINNAHKSFSYILHSYNFISKFLKYLQPEVLDKFDHICTLRIALHKLALAFNDNIIGEPSKEDIVKMNKIVKNNF